jgi:hypothetical protein
MGLGTVNWRSRETAPSRRPIAFSRGSCRQCSRSAAALMGLFECLVANARVQCTSGRSADVLRQQRFAGQNVRNADEGRVRRLHRAPRWLGFGEEPRSPRHARRQSDQRRPDADASEQAARIPCPNCAWAKPAKPHLFEFCENGAKATIWEVTRDRATPEFFARHSLRELESWDDHALEATGRLTRPLPL